VGSGGGERGRRSGGDQAGDADRREAAVGDAVDVAEQLGEGAIIDRRDGGALDDGAEDVGAVDDGVGDDRRPARISMQCASMGLLVGEHAMSDVKPGRRVACA
jgi:hypothetical protein